MMASFDLAVARQKGSPLPPPSRRTTTTTTTTASRRRRRRKFITLSHSGHWNHIRLVLKRGLSVFPPFSSYQIWEEYSCASLGCACKASRILLRVTERSQAVTADGGHTAASAVVVQIHRFLTNLVALEVIGGTVDDDDGDVDAKERVLRTIFDAIAPLTLM